MMIGFTGLMMDFIVMEKYCGVFKFVMDIHDVELLTLDLVSNMLYLQFHGGIT